MPQVMWHDVFEPLAKAFKAAIVLAGHLFISLVMIGVIFVVEWAFGYAFGPNQPLVWGLFPLKYLFQAPEVGAMVVFTVWGIIEAHRVMKG